MADTIRTKSALITLLADNTTGAITEQVQRDVLVSVMGCYGEIYCEDNSTAQTAMITPAILTCWNTATGFNGLGVGVTPAKASNYITINNAGDYIIQFNAAITNAANGTTFKFYIHQNSTKLSGGTYTKPPNNDVVTVATHRLVTLAVNDNISIYVESNTDTKSLTVTDAVLSVRRIG